MGLDHLWAGWRSAYIESVTGDPDRRPDDEVRPPPSGEGSLFERILTMPDRDGFVVHRGVTCAALLNAYPYTNGHVLVMPLRAVGELHELTEEEHDELWRLVRDTVAAVRGAYRCPGVNVGLNLGEAAGAGVPDHLHAHVLPRWPGDTNFMTAVAETRVLPESLGTTWQKLRDAWPSASSNA